MPFPSIDDSAGAATRTVGGDRRRGKAAMAGPLEPSPSDAAGGSPARRAAEDSSELDGGREHDGGGSIR